MCVVAKDQSSFPAIFDKMHFRVPKNRNRPVNGEQYTSEEKMIPGTGACKRCSIRMCALNLDTSFLLPPFWCIGPARIPRSLI